MALDKLINAANRLRYYEDLLSVVDKMVEQPDPRDVLLKKQRTYRQYVAMYRKKYLQAKERL